MSAALNFTYTCMADQKVELAKESGEFGELSAFVEMVSIFRCRVCNETYSTISEITDHVQQVHFISPESGMSCEIHGEDNVPCSTEKTESLYMDTTSTKNLGEEQICAETQAADCLDGSSLIPCPLSTILSVNAASLPDEQGLDDYVDSETQAADCLDGSSLIPCPSSTILSVNAASLPDEQGLDDHVDSAHLNHLLHNLTASLVSCTRSPTGAFSTVIGDATAPQLSCSPSSLERSVSSACELPAGNEQMPKCDEVHSVGPASITAPFLDSDPSIIPHEVFLCGICKNAYLSMDDCRCHMAEEHGIDMVASGLLDAASSNAANCTNNEELTAVSRLGRKRKSEFHNGVAVAKKMSLGSLRDDATDEDWVPGRSMKIGKQRRIRPPRLLADGAVVDSKRKYHIKQEATTESYSISCDYTSCSMKFRCQEALTIHRSCHSQHDDTYACPRCRVCFPIWKTLRIHLWRVHRVDCDLFSCNTCKYRTDTLHKLGIHQEIHSIERPYTCVVCNRGFKQLSQLKNHQLVHAEYQRLDHDSYLSRVCSTCKRVFANVKCLKSHVEAVHGQSKPFKCSYCNHATAWKAMLLLHERTHTGEKPFKCDACPYATGDHNCLRRHKMRHTGHRQYKCQFCDYTCIQTISLKAHLRSKHPDSHGVIGVCSRCNFRTSDRAIFDNHMEDHRRGLIADGFDQPLRQPFGVSDGPLTAASLQYQMSVKRVGCGELQADKLDVDKLNALRQVINLEMDAGQLLSTVLNIGSEIGSMEYTAQLSNGVHCCVSPSADHGNDPSYLVTFTFTPHEFGVPGTAFQSTAAVTASADSTSNEDLRCDDMVDVLDPTVEETNNTVAQSSCAGQLSANVDPTHIHTSEHAPGFIDSDAKLAANSDSGAHIVSEHNSPSGQISEDYWTTDMVEA